MAQVAQGRQEKLRQILREKKRQLWTELRQDMFHDTGEELADQYTVPLDPPEAGVIDLLQDMGLTISEIREQELTRMEEAEQRLREGTFGICQQCGREIDERRLEAVPYALTCVDCQRENEREKYPPPHVTM